MEITRKAPLSTRSAASPRRFPSPKAKSLHVPVTLAWSIFVSTRFLLVCFVTLFSHSKLEIPILVPFTLTTLGS